MEQRAGFAGNSLIEAECGGRPRWWVTGKRSCSRVFLRGLALQIRRDSFPIQTLETKVPRQSNCLRNVAFTVIASLIPERSIQNQASGHIHQCLQHIFRSECDFPVDSDTIPVDRHRFPDRIETHHDRRRVLEGARLRGGAFLQSPFDWDIALNARSVNVHSGFQVSFEAEHDPVARLRHLCARRGDEAKMFGLRNAACGIRLLSEVLHQNVRSGDTLTVIVFEVL